MTKRRGREIYVELPDGTDRLVGIRFGSTLHQYEPYLYMETDSFLIPERVVVEYADVTRYALHHEGFVYTVRREMWHHKGKSVTLSGIEYLALRREFFDGRLDGEDE